jgi:hypothetical protein
MCVGFDPVSIGAIASLVGTGVSAYGQKRQGDAAAAAAEYEQKQNTILAEDALKRGEQEKDAVRRRTAALEGRQRAVLAASNLDLGSGSPLAILSDTAMLGELDAQVIQGNAERERAGLMAGADMAGMRAKSAKQAGAIGAFSTVMSGVGTLADKWYKPRTAAAR